MGFCSYLHYLKNKGYKLDDKSIIKIICSYISLIDIPKTYKGYLVEKEWYLFQYLKYYNIFIRPNLNILDYIIFNEKKDLIIEDITTENFSKKKIKIGDLKQFHFKNFPIYQDIKPQTYRKDK